MPKGMPAMATVKRIAVNVNISVNGKPYAREVEPRMLLVEFLREACDLTGTHVGCDTTYCGACTVLMNGLAVKSCTMFAVQADGRDLRAVGLHRKQGAGLYRQAVHQHGASAAVCCVATDVRAGKVTCLAQELNQQHARLDLPRVGLAVHADADGGFFYPHGCGCGFRHRDGPLRLVLRGHGARQSEWRASPELRPVGACIRRIRACQAGDRLRRERLRRRSKSSCHSGFSRGVRSRTRSRGSPSVRRSRELSRHPHKRRPPW